MNTTSLKQQKLDALYAPYRKCTECPLGSLGRTNVVFGEGNPDSLVMFIGEAPGKDEDIQGKPFVGQSGRLLTKALNLAGIAREEVFITNIVKCRPPQNRVPLPLEISICTKLFLFHQIAIVQPRIICSLGSTALNALVGEKRAITRVHGIPVPFKDGITLLPTYHPAYILRNRGAAQAWVTDLKLLAELLSTLKK